MAVNALILVSAAALLPVLVLVFVVLPRRVFRAAAGNVRRLDGAFSHRRFRREVKHLASLTWALLVLDMLVMGTVACGLIAVDAYVVPLPMVSKIMSQFDLDPVQWEYNIEHGRYGDIGAQYEAWSRSRGFSATTARFWQEFLWLQWGAIVIIGLALGYYGLRFLVRWYKTAVLGYADGVFYRRTEYQIRDAKSLAKAHARRRRASQSHAGTRHVETGRNLRPD
ncbi:MAG TPA: hypothetical protein VFG50_01680 [Rhodothermales bacterium]|nr:hypothetical protein [Rhodothermales bacterium]